MKKIFLTLTAILGFFSLSQAQVDTESLIDNALSMVQKGDNNDIGRALDLVSGGLKGSLASGDGIFKDKLMSQANGLAGLTSALKSGVADKGALGKTLGVLKTMLAAQSLSNLVKGGGLAGKASKVASSIGVLKAGLPLLNNAGGKLGDVTKLLDKVTGKSAVLDKTGFFAKFGQKAAKKKLGSALEMLNGMF